MFDDVYRVAKKPIKSWAHAAKVPATQAESEYFRILQSLTNEWITSDTGLSPLARKSNIQKLLKLEDGGRFAGIKAALHYGLNTPLEMVPDYQIGWTWLLDSPDSLPKSILWQAYLSQHEVVVRQAEGMLESDPNSGSLLFKWLQDTDSSLSQAVIDEWAELSAAVQLAVWERAVSRGHAIDVHQFDLKGAPWLGILSKPPTSTSKEWKIITTAPEDVVSRFFANASTAARLAAIETLLKSPKELRVLANVFAGQRFPIPLVDAAPEITFILDQMAEKPSVFDLLAPALLQYASASYSWPRWFRIRCEADCCMNWSKSPYKLYIGEWAELSLGHYPASSRHELFRSAKSPLERSQYNNRWLTWYRNNPDDAWQGTREVFWKELSEAPLTPDILSLLMKAQDSPMKIPQVVELRPLSSLATLSELGIQGDPESLDRYMPVTSLRESLKSAHEDLYNWWLNLVVALIRHGLANADDVGVDVLIDARQSLADEIHHSWLAFEKSLNDCLTKLSVLAETEPSIFPLVAEIIALRSAQTLESPIPDPEPAEDSGAWAVDVRLLAIAKEEMTAHENSVIKGIMSPLEKMFDLDLAPLLNEVQTCLASLDLAWITARPCEEDWDPSRHALVGTAPSAHVTIRLQSPGLIRHREVLTKAWGEPVEQKEE